MKAKWKFYIPLMLFLPLLAAAAAFALAAVIPAKGLSPGTATVKYLHTGAQPSISESNGPVEHQKLKHSPKEGNVSLEELNRRLLAEGLDPILPADKPPPPPVSPSGSPATLSIEAIEIEEPPLPETSLRAEEPALDNPPKPIETPPEPPAHPEAQVESKPAENEDKRPVDIFTEPAYDQYPKPPYPHAAERKGLEGTVILKIQVGIDGYPKSVEIASSSGHAILDRAAIEAVRGSWHFNPATKNGRAIEWWVEVPIRFSLD